MKFEIGKYYQHSGGRKISIIGELQTTFWSWQNLPTLIGECDDASLRPIGRDENATVNWSEITKEEWLKNIK